jgi:hypothetical protein
MGQDVAEVRSALDYDRVASHFPIAGSARG